MTDLDCEIITIMVIIPSTTDSECEHLIAMSDHLREHGSILAERQRALLMIIERCYEMMAKGEEAMICVLLEPRFASG